MSGKPISPVWHPFAQHGLIPEFKSIKRAEGAYLFAADGTQYLDAISSWWVITHGHCYPRIQEAIRQQSEFLDQIIFANFTHESAEELAKQLVALTPDGLDYVFYSDSGSTSVEVALKMALGYWKHSGERRNRLLVMQHGYHGDTIGTMSVGERGTFTTPYEPLLFDVETVPFPQPGREQETLDALDAACRQSSPPPAALIVEPLMLGAAGMLFYSPDVLREMKRICEHRNVLFIADEVATGWGRTGTLFACEQADITPDIACYGKGLTGGSLPLAVTMCASRIFDAHLSTDRRKTFFHSSSYTANPIACAAALENIKIWQDEPVLERIGNISEWHREHLPSIQALDGIKNVRQLGTISALDIEVQDPGYFSELNPAMQSYFMSRGYLLRPIGNTIYILPPYCITAAQIRDTYSVIADFINDLNKSPEKIMR